MQSTRDSARLERRQTSITDSLHSFSDRDAQSPFNYTKDDTRRSSCTLDTKPRGDSLRVGKSESSTIAPEEKPSGTSHRRLTSDMDHFRAVELPQRPSESGSEGQASRVRKFRIDPAPPSFTRPVRRLLNQTSSTQPVVLTGQTDQTNVSTDGADQYSMVRPMRLWAAFTKSVEANRDSTALTGREERVLTDENSSRVVNRGEVSYTWAEYYGLTQHLTNVLVSLGIDTGDGAVFTCRSCPHLYMLNMAMIALGGVVGHVRQSWTSDELLQHIWPDANARVVVLDDSYPNIIEALQVQLAQQQETPSPGESDISDEDEELVRLRLVVLLGSKVDPISFKAQLPGDVLVYTIGDLLDPERMGRVPQVSIEHDLQSRLRVSDPCVVDFGYDALGRIVGTCLSHDNIVFTAFTLHVCFGPLTRNDRMVGYMQLHHVGTQVLEIYLPIMCGLGVTCAPTFSRQNLLQVLSERRPTVFFATPDTWTHLSHQVYRMKGEVNPFLYSWAKLRATNNSLKLRSQSGGHRSLGYMLAKGLVLNGLKKRLGLESCHACYSVLSPLDLDLEKLFKTIDVPIYQLFGNPSTSGFATVNYPHNWEFGSSGMPLQGTQVKCDEETQEVLVRGRNVCLGYIRDGSFVPQQAHHGWLHISQRGHLTPADFLNVSPPPRFIVLSTGDWAPVQPFENALQQEPEIDRAVLVGDGRPYLCVLLFLKTQVARGRANSQPHLHANGNVPGRVGKKLSEEAMDVGHSVGSQATTVDEVARCQYWAVHFDRVLDDLPDRARVSGVRVCKWIVMTEAFSVESGEIDPTSGRVRREMVDSKHHRLLASLYE